MKKILLVFVLFNFVSCLSNTGATLGKASGGLENDEVTNASNVEETNALKSSQDRNNPMLYENTVVDEDKVEEKKRENFIGKYNEDYDRSQQVEALRAKAIDARVDKRGVIINLSDALFGFNSAELTVEAKLVITEIAKFFQTVSNDSILVEGHTDSVGTVMYNQKLSEQRARNVVDELVKNGVSRSRLKAKGFGESDPVATNRTEEGRLQNRRVELVF